LGRQETHVLFVVLHKAEQQVDSFELHEPPVLLHDEHVPFVSHIPDEHSESFEHEYPFGFSAQRPEEELQ